MNTYRVTYTAGGASSGGGSYFVNALMEKLQGFICLLYTSRCV